MMGITTSKEKLNKQGIELSKEPGAQPQPRQLRCDEIPHRTAPDPQKLGEGSPQPGKTMGSPGTLPL